MGNITISFKIINKTKMLTITASLQSQTGSPSQCSKTRKRNKTHKDQKEGNVYHAQITCLFTKKTQNSTNDVLEKEI